MDLQKTPFNMIKPWKANMDDNVCKTLTMMAIHALSSSLEWLERQSRLAIELRKGL